LETLQLKALYRQTVGNGPARALRRQGLFPAVVYGRQTESIPLCLKISEFDLLIKKHNIYQAVLKLTIENGKTAEKTVMVKDVQVHPVNQNFLHVDFYEVDMARKIRVNVPVVTTGTAVGVERGGILQIIRRELEVLCLPGEIPEVFEIDISNLDLGDAVHVEEIPLSGDVEIPHDVNFTVITVTSPKIEAVEEEEEEAEEEAAEEAGEEEAAGEGEEE
jgi:large subunit ribosomal protein L25